MRYIASRMPTGTVRYARSRLSSLPLILAILASGCDLFYCLDRLEPPPPTLKALHVIPPTVYVTPGSKFVLRARILDDQNGVLPGHPQLSWPPVAGLRQVAAQGDSVVLHADALTANTTVTVKAQIPAEGLSGAAELIVIAANAPGSADAVFADARAVAPDVVLVDGRVTTGDANDSLIAFAEAGVLGHFSGTGEVVRLAADRRFLEWKGNLRTGRVNVNLRATTPQAPLRPSIMIWDATTAGAAADIADDMDYAHGVHARQRVGVAFDYVLQRPSFRGSYSLEQDANFNCTNLFGKLVNLGIPQTDLVQNGLIVVYVDELDPRMSGYACPIDAEVGSVLFISEISSTTTLAHELGHALGLIKPDADSWGHTHALTGFSYTNMMWARPYDDRQSARATFTLGQAFRMNVGQFSWLVGSGYAPWASRDCPDVSASPACPALAQDIVPLP